MKKVISLLLCMILLLCACTKGEKNVADKIDISFQKIAACNSRSKLLEKYQYISERTASRAEENENFSYWIMYYEKEQENINAILNYSADYKCYYYNNQIFTEYGDSQFRHVISYRESYDKIMADLLARTDTLSYVFVIDSHAFKNKEGYKARFDFIVNNDILPELEGLGVENGDRVRVAYDLNEDYEINKCSYYRIDEEKNVEVARIDVTYGTKVSFPQQITTENNDNAGYANVTIVEDYGTGSQYEEVFKVKKGRYITENDVLMSYFLYKDPTYRTMFDTTAEIINEDTTIYVMQSTHAEILAYYEEQQALQDQEQKSGEVMGE